MSSYIHFFSAHLFLTLGALVTLLLLIINEVQIAKTQGQSYTSQSLIQGLNHHDIQVVDIRDKGDFKAGHIGGSRSIPADQLDNKVTELSQDKPIVLVCDKGIESAKYKTLLGKRGIHVNLLIGGIAQWKQDNLPLEK